MPAAEGNGHRRWADLAERGSPVLVRLIHWIATRIGRPVARTLLYPITLYFLLRAGPQRRASRDYLRRVLAREPGWRDVFRHIHCFAATILDRALLLTGEYNRFDVRIYQGEILLGQVASGRGCILLGSHLGSFEVLRVLGVSQHCPLKVLMDPKHNSAITRFMNALNPEIADTVIVPGGPETLLKVKESLDAGFLVGTLGDRLGTDGKSTQCTFLGAPARFPASPVLLAALMECPIILFFGLYRGANRYDVHFELLTDGLTLERSQRARDIQAWTQRYVERLEAYTRRAPYNWFNFYPFWDHYNDKSGSPAENDLAHR
ncbi:MAG: lipid A biosynthesis acyltransferase [Nitrococcus sp.]|nr:lipid A biosynthesis acyltransferase [Nitrococcus sp.]